MQSWRSDVFVQSNVSVETNGQCFKDDTNDETIIENEKRAALDSGLPS